MKYEIYRSNYEYIYQKLVLQSKENRQTTPRLKTTASNLNIVKKHIKSILIKGVISSKVLAEPKQMVRAESANACIAGIDTH